MLRAVVFFIFLVATVQSRKKLFMEKILLHDRIYRKTKRNREKERGHISTTLQFLGLSVIDHLIWRIKIHLLNDANGEKIVQSDH